MQQQITFSNNADLYIIFNLGSVGFAPTVSVPTVFTPTPFVPTTSTLSASETTLIHSSTLATSKSSTPTSAPHGTGVLIAHMRGGRRRKKLDIPKQPEKRGLKI